MKTALAGITFVLFSMATSVMAAAGGATAANPGGGATVVDPVTGMEFVLVKGGCYKMGSVKGTEDEAPVHEVCVADFYLGKYEVTQKQWEQVMKSNPSHFTACGPACPVESVSWDDAQEFIKKLNVLSKKKYRLPTEAEWEYAARSGGKDETYAGTSDDKSLGDFAWIVENAGETTHPVGLKKANGLGLYDMTGNVDEWCQDRYAEEYYRKSPKSNPTGPSAGAERATRGGSFDFNAWRARVAHRSKFEAGLQEELRGLRLLLPVK